MNLPPPPLNLPHRRSSLPSPVVPLPPPQPQVVPDEIPPAAEEVPHTATTTTVARVVVVGLVEGVGRERVPLLPLLSVGNAEEDQRG